MSKKINIYLVDDDPIFSIIAKVMLDKMYDGIHFVCLGNGEDALRAIDVCPEADRPTILFLDINMPIMDGWDFLLALDKTISYSFPICMMSSSIDPEDRRLANENPRIIDFIEKPFDKERMMGLINPLVCN